MRSSIYNIIDFENSRKRECESDYFNSKFFEMFPTKYEKLLREYEVILFKGNVKISFLSMDFSDYKGIYVVAIPKYGEIQKVTGELIGASRELAAELFSTILYTYIPLGIS